MSSKSRKLSDQIVRLRITTVLQVLSIMSSEARQMSWFQRFRISQSFLWEKNIECFFEVASKSKKKDEKKGEKKEEEKDEKRDKEV